jgi:hypothetical protein
MTDYYLLLTPFLMLAVVTLLGFIGCAGLVGIEDWDPQGESAGGNGDTLPAPTNLVAVAGDAVVNLSWDAYTNAAEYHVKRGNTSGQYDSMFPVGAQSPTYDDTLVVNDKTYYYVVSAIISGNESKDSEETPPVTPTAPTIQSGYFVTKATPGTPSNAFDGWAGMEILVDASSIIVSKVGRLFATNNVQQHAIKIIDKGTNIDLTTAILDTIGGTDGDFQYVDLPSPVTLISGSSYYIVGNQYSGGDQFYLDDSTIQHTTAAKVVSAISGDGASPYVSSASEEHCFGPLDFYYEIAP